MSKARRIGLKTGRRNEPFQVERLFILSYFSPGEINRKRECMILEGERVVKMSSACCGQQNPRLPHRATSELQINQERKGA
ncbi:hypothetical protein CEXT_668371 [Caerostris extrusa]|uniref:Ribosomal protein S16 n=1 Tax=Caerostris extrusa TaxID=172846 RepID=A0AAV4UBT5_CAEEX|nr:hypothetical protein CEXT_668371 [Caerostris extrusa]